jgi:hypothetical protein
MPDKCGCGSDLESQRTIRIAVDRFQPPSVLLKNLGIVLLHQSQILYEISKGEQKKGGGLIVPAFDGLMSAAYPVGHRQPDGPLTSEQVVESRYQGDKICPESLAPIIPGALSVRRQIWTAMQHRKHDL